MLWKTGESHPGGVKEGFTEEVTLKLGLEGDELSGWE